jgi:hypothetical protein
MKIVQVLAYCSCPEIKDKNGDEYSRIPQWHNCDYIRKRNRLIKEAEAYALDNSKKPNGKMDGYKFTQVFSTKMDQLAKEAKLV